MADLTDIDDVDDGEKDAPWADGTAQVVDVDPAPGFTSTAIAGNMQGGLVG
jgi:hypothetical protein